MDILTDVYDIDGSEFISIYLVQAKPGWTVVSGFSFLLSAGSEDRPLVGCCTTPQRSSLITSHRHPHLRVAINGLRDAAWLCTYTTTAYKAVLTLGAASNMGCVRMKPPNTVCFFTLFLMVILGYSAALLPCCSPPTQGLASTDLNNLFGVSFLLWS